MITKWQVYKKDFHDTDNHDGVIPQLEMDILECEVRRALESITKNKASGGDPLVISSQNEHFNKFCYRQKYSVKCHSKVLSIS